MFLMGLNEAFGGIKTHILSVQPTPTVAQAFHLVLEDEQQRHISASSRSNTAEAAAFQTQRRDASSEWQVTNPNRPRCHVCRRTGHTREECFDVIGYPEGWFTKSSRGTGRRGRFGGRNPKAAQVDGSSEEQPTNPFNLTPDQIQKFMNLLNSTGQSGKNPTAAAAMAGNKSHWIIDSASTDHITCDSYALVQRDHSVVVPPVKIPNGDFIPVKGVGNKKLNSTITLPGVLDVPKFKCNLISVSRLTKDLNCSITFLRDGCMIQDLHTKKLIGRGELRGGLYYWKQDVSDQSQAMVSRRSISMDHWHQRLGHASSAKLKQLFNGLSVDSSVLPHCDACVRAKQTRIVFPHSSIKTTACFELLHCDIWGDYKTASFTGAHYFLTIVDDFSRAVWVFLMKQKSETGALLTTFCTMVRSQFNGQVRRIRADNGLEFQSNYIRTYYQEHGIILETSCTDTPQQNGVVERKHRHLLEMARALRFQANLPIKFWGECILTAAYLINRLPLKAIADQVPYNILFGTSPTYDHLRVFGCLAYAHNNKQHKDKFDERGCPGVFVGYPYAQKGYRIYDLQTHRIVTSRDVHFVENQFPFRNSPPHIGIPSSISPADGLDAEREKLSPFINANNDLAEPINESIEENKESQVTVNEVEIGDSFGNDTAVITEGVEATITEFETTQNEFDGQPIDANTTFPVRRSSRQRQLPHHLNDYDTSLPPSLADTDSPSVATTQVYPITKYLSYEKMSANHAAYLSKITTQEEPRSYAQAAMHSHWRKAMKAEIDALIANGTWELVNPPNGKKIVDCKWVYKIKYKPNGEVERYKARLVARGFTQIPGVDFHETFAPVAKLVTVRCLVAIAVAQSWNMHQLDVNNAFLHGDLSEEVYMKLPQGYDGADGTKVCRLRKSIYGLRQASRNWHAKFSSSLLNLGFEQSKADYSMYVYKKDAAQVIALIYVDDVILTGNDETFISKVKSQLDEEFSIKDLGPLKYFLGIEVTRTIEGVTLNQRKYALDILQDSGMEDSKPSSFPMEQHHTLGSASTPLQEDEGRYRRLVGRLLYLMITRPDIQYAVNLLCQFVNAPKQEHWDALKWVVRYIKQAPAQGLHFPKENKLVLRAYCDADWGGCALTRRSTTGYFIQLGASPISWRTKKQQVVSQSSAEAEYRAMAATVSELIWLRQLMLELNVQQQGPTILHCDNQAAIHIASNPVFHERTKHVEMDCHFVRERVVSKEVMPMKISSTEQVADMFTKALGRDRLAFLLDKLSVCNLHAPT
ncbi:Retrovirus-related Pol polyprotein from transposon TNT 1-94 [Linum grandiflorum]